MTVGMSTRKAEFFTDIHLKIIQHNMECTIENTQRQGRNSAVWNALAVFATAIPT